MTKDGPRIITYGEVVARIRAGEFRQLTIALMSESDPQVNVTLYDDAGVDHISRFADALSSPDDTYRTLDVEIEDGILYVLAGKRRPVKVRQVYVDQCPNCDIGTMQTDDYVIGQRDGDFTIDLHCDTCMASVTINVEEYEDWEEYNDEGL